MWLWECKLCPLAGALRWLAMTSKDWWEHMQIHAARKVHGEPKGG